MSFEWFQPYIYVIIDIFALLAAALGCLVVYKLWRKEYNIQTKKSVIIFFLMLAIGSILYASAEISWSVLDYLYGEMPTPGIPDILWVMGYFFILGGFLYFAVYMYRHHGQLKKGLAMMAAVGITSALVLYYLISSYILGFQEGESTLLVTLDYFYPIMSAIILTVSINVYIFFRKLGNLGVPLLYLAISNLLNFFGDILYTYYSWNNVYGIAGVLSDSLYAISYIGTAYALYMLFTRINVEKA